MMLSLSILLGMAVAQPQVPLSVKEMISTGEEAFVLMPPVHVAADVEFATWSSDSKSLAFITADRSSEAKLIVDAINGKPVEGKAPLGRQRIGTYSTQTEKVRWMPDLPTGCIPAQIHWAPEDQSVVALVFYFDPQSPSKEEMEMGVVSARVGATRWVDLARSNQESNPVHLEIHANQDLGLLLVLANSTAQRRTHAMKIDRSGTFTHVPEVISNAIQAGWRPSHDSPDGWMFYNYTASTKVNWQVLTADLSFKPLERADLEKQRVKEAKGITLEQGPGPVAEMLYLRPRGGDENVPPKMTFVCQHVEWSGLSPNQFQIGYTSQRMLWVRPLQPISIEMYAQAVAAQLRAEAISRAKQVAVAWQIYLADHHDTWDGGDPISLLEPYTKNRSLFDGFVFNIPVGNAIDIKSPAETEIGHIPMAGGRVVAYADSSVRWVPDK